MGYKHNAHSLYKKPPDLYFSLRIRLKTFRRVYEYANMSRFSEDAKSIILISDGNGGGQNFENNTQSYFINRFPIDVDCQTFQHEVALTKIKFLNSIYNLPKGELHNIRVDSRDSTGGVQETNLELPPGYYSIKDIQQRVEEKFREFSMDVDSPSGRVIIKNVKGNDERAEVGLRDFQLHFSDTLGKILGFQVDSNFVVKQGEEVSAPNVFNVNQTNQLYVYCSMIVSDHLVGGMLTNLLCICPITTTEFNKCVIYEPTHLNFLPVKRQNFLYARIHIYDHGGKPVSFLSGSVEVHIKLRRSTPFF